MNLPLRRAPTAPAASEAVAAAKPRIKSQISVLGPTDDRSIKQLKREIKAQIAKREQAAMASLPRGLEEEEGDDNNDEEGRHSEDAGSLAEMMDSMMGLTGKRGLLQGVPRPLGSHIRFEDDGTELPSPTSGKTLLTGVPTPKGNHTRFQE